MISRGQHYGAVPNTRLLQCMYWCSLIISITFEMHVSLRITLGCDCSIKVLIYKQKTFAAQVTSAIDHQSHITSRSQYTQLNPCGCVVVFLSQLPTACGCVTSRAVNQTNFNVDMCCVYRCFTLPMTESDFLGGQATQMSTFLE